MGVRLKLTENCGLGTYRDFRWKEQLRLDYSPSDCFQFHQAILEAAVPAATRMYERYRSRLGVDSLRPWDLEQDLYPMVSPPIPSYGGTSDLKNQTRQVFKQLDQVFADHFSVMIESQLLDLENRVGKAPGAYCTSFPRSRVPFIFMNAVGSAEDIRTILHESGHAFHNFERIHQPYFQQRHPGLEFAEVASMTMELFCHPFLFESDGGFYNRIDTARFRIAHLQRMLAFWPYMAVVDSYQHWVYENPQLALHPGNCDAKWLELSRQYIPGIDWHDFEDIQKTGWHRKLHIFRAPFYYIEYGLAQLGAVQIWHAYLRDPRTTLENYRKALSLGGTRSLPDLYHIAGAEFSFDRSTLADAVGLIENNIRDLEKVAY
jgi:oligoendopeptidase F